MKTISIAAIAALAALASGAAAADEKPNYTYIELAYSGGNVEGPNSPAALANLGESLPPNFRISSNKLDQDTSGYKVKGSLTIADEFFVSGSYLFSDRNGVEYADVSSWQANAGFIRALNDTATFDMSLVYRRDEVKSRTWFSVIEEDPDTGDVLGVTPGRLDNRSTYKGVGVNFGLRKNWTDWLELYARGGYLWGEWEGALTVDTGAVWNITDLLAVTTSYEYVNVDDEGNDYELSQLQVGARVKF